jgi:hypothetical protein
MVLGQLAIFNRSLVALDEGQMAEIGHRLLTGEVLYRDVHTGVFPGIYWLVETMFRLFGTDVLVLRVASLSINTLIAVALFLLARPLVKGRAIYLMPLLHWMLIVASFPGLTMLTYSATSLLCALVALLFIRRYAADARLLDGIAAGVMLAACTLFKQNFGLLTLIAAFVSALWVRGEGRLSQRSLLRAFAPPIIAGLLIAVAATLRIVLSGAWPAFFEATFVKIFELGDMTAYNQPLPPVLGAHPMDDPLFRFYYSPAAMFLALLTGDPLVRMPLLSMAIRVAYGSAYLALALAPLLAWRFGYDADAGVRRSARVFFPFAVVFFFGIFPSAIWSHLAIVYPPLLVVLVSAAAWAFTALRRAAPSAATVLRAGALGMALAGALFAVRLQRVVREHFRVPMQLSGVHVRVTERDVELHHRATEFLRTCAAPSEPVFVATDMPILYVTAARRNPTPYDLIIPGDVREDVILERLRGASVSCVVFAPKMYAQFAPFEQLFPALADYLASEFAVAQVASVQGVEWRFLQRRPEEAPS